MQISDRLRQQIDNPQPDVDQFIKVIAGRKPPERVHFVELFADEPVMVYVSEHLFEHKWAHDSVIDREQRKRNLLCQIEYWHRMGYDYIRVGGGVDFAGSTKRVSNDTATLSKGQRGWADTTATLIQSFEDLEKYPWPVVKDENLWMYEFVAEHLPEGMGIFACPAPGLFEMTCKLGYQTLCYLMYDQPDLVAEFIRRVGDISLEVCQKVVQIPRVVGFFPGDDMGYKSATMVAPYFLREQILPWHKEIARLAHEHGKVYFLHSCGNLESIMPDLIDDVRIDGKHSFEDEIMPVESFAAKYGSRVGVLGGVPVDLLARGSEEQVHQRVRHILEKCMPVGRYALGSGNSVANYVQPENFLAMLDEGLAYRER